MTGSIETYVRASDAFALLMERDPLLRSTVVAVALFDAAPDWDVLTSRIERATRLTPTFRQKLVPTPLRLASPRWTDDPDFDLSFHLRRVEAPAPKTFDTVLALARNAGMAAFDPARPLWEFTLVDGLTDGRAALVMKVHHSLTDGIGGLQLAAHVVDLERTPADLGPLPPAPPVRVRGSLDVWRDLVRYDAGRALGLTRAAVAAAPAQAWRTVRDPVGSVTRGVRTTASLARFVRPITTTLSPVMTARRLRWHYDVIDVPLAPLRLAAKQAEGTINDAFLAGIAGGLRRYHAAHGAAVDTLRLTMPISVRTADDPEGGNRITLVRFEAPVGVEEPVARMREIDAQCRAIRHEPALPLSNAVAGVLNLLPGSVTGGMLKHVDFLASDVPGFRDTVYVGGAELIGFYPFGPTLGSATNLTLMSYRGTCHIGVNTDAGAVPDPDVFLDCLREGFEEVLAVGGEHEPVRSRVA